MAQAHYNNQYNDGLEPYPHPGSAHQTEHDMSDWNSLRDELENLLDEVHVQTQEAHSRRQNNYAPSQSGWEPQHQNQPSAPAVLDRQTQALASVKRAVDRFSEPEEAMLMPAQSQHQLQNAIRQIRSSQRHPSPRGRTNAPLNFGANSHHAPAQPRQNAYREPQRPQRSQNNQFMQNQFEGISDALGGISSRMEQFEHAIGAQSNSDAAVADMAMQIEQLSGVVEHLANNVGERGQMKRLENQIAKMADAIPTGDDLDFTSLNKRLDTLSGAFEQLRDLQAQQVELNIKSNGEGGYMDSIEDGVRNIYERLDGMGLDKLDLEPVESCVRTVYDRIDALEQTMAMPTPTIERLSREMADFTAAMRDEDSANLSSDLIAQVGGLVSRIEEMETDGGQVSELKSDMAQLQSSVVGAMEPRFAALEIKIGDLSGQIAKQPAGQSKDNTNATVATLEKHIRVLATKLDKTSADLSGLKEVFHQKPDGAAVPNINAIADIVAQRTSQAVEKMQGQPVSGIEQKSLDQLEARLSGLFEKQKPQQNPAVFDAVQSSIEQVNQRLARLEGTLSEQAKQDATNIEIENDTQTQAGPTQSNVSRKRPAPKRARHPGLSDNEASAGDQQHKSWEPSRHLIPELRDNMPRPPAQDGPLKAPLFNGDQGEIKRSPVPASLRSDPNDLQVSENEVAEIDEPPKATKKANPAPQDPPIKLPKFTDENVAPPPQPASDFATGGNANTPAANPKTASPTHPIGEQGQKPNSIDQNQSPKRSNTRKLDANKTVQNAHAQGATPASNEPANVSRSTFIEAARRAAQSNNGKIDQPGSQSIIARAMARFQKNKADKSAEKTPANARETSFAGDDTQQSMYDATDDANASKDTNLDDLTTVPESFLTRHRQPILLVATVVAVGFLTLNLINQRFAGGEPVTAAPVGEMTAPTMPAPAMTDPDMAAAQMDAPTTATSVPVPAQPADDAKSEKPGTELDGAPLAVDGDTVGSIDRFSGVPGSPVRMIDPNISVEMPNSLEQPASVTSASLNLDVPNLSPLGLEMPPEAIGPLQLRQTAADGDARSQFEIAAIFAEGRAMPQDLAAAARWYERAAAQGFAPASYRLANMLENGVGVDKDLASARLWYQLAADAGNRMSMHNLASLLAGGQLGEQQFEQAAHWFEQAANLGLADSQFNLGMLYARGLGVTQSLESSFKWFSIAANGGDEDAAKTRDDIARSLEPQIVARLQDEILAWEPTKMNIRANFAPIGTWSLDFDPGPPIDAREVIFKVQAALNGIGYDTGTPDGLIGPKTIEAINGFEVETGMVPSGKVNPRLLAVLGSQPV